MSTKSVQGGAHEIDLRPMPGFNIVTFKVDVAFTDHRDAEQFYADLGRMFHDDAPITLTYEPPAETDEDERIAELRERVEDLAGQSQSEAQEELDRLLSDRASGTS